MNSRQPVLVKQWEKEVLEEHERLSNELFKRLPLGRKIHAYIFAVVFVGLILINVWAVGYTVYALIFKRS